MLILDKKMFVSFSIRIGNFFLSTDVCYHYYLYIADSWSISQAQSNNTSAQKWLTVAHYRIGVSTQPTLRNILTTPQL